MRRLLAGLTLGILVALLMLWLWERHRRYDTALRADSLAAALDTTRQVYLRALSGERAWERRAIQRKQAADALERELRRLRRARVSIGVEVARLDTVLLAARDTVMRWSLRREPYTVRAEVRPPDSLDLAIALDRLDLGIRLQCDTAAIAGVRAATVLVQAPPWATITLDHVEQSPEVCSRRPVAPPPWREPRILAAVVMVAGVLLLAR